MESVLESLKKKEVTAKCLGLVTDKAERGCVMKAKAFGIPIEIVEMAKDESREAYDKRLDAAIRKLSGDKNVLIACMGWMWILSPWFVKQWYNKIINVHPALLPKHPGAHAHELVLTAKEQETGMTIHIVDEGVDTGTILLQKTCPVLQGDTKESLQQRVQALECEWYPKTLQMIEQGEIKVNNE